MQTPGSICLNSALSFWDLTDEVSAEVHLAECGVKKSRDISQCPREAMPVQRQFRFRRCKLRIGGDRMAERKAKLKPSHRPKPADYRGATRRAQEVHDRLEAQGYRFPDSTEIVRRDRDTRV